VRRSQIIGLALIGTIFILALFLGSERIRLAKANEEGVMLWNIIETSFFHKVLTISNVYHDVVVKILG
jgi:hypothetical protein